MRWRWLRSGRCGTGAHLSQGAHMPAACIGLQAPCYSGQRACSPPKATSPVALHLPCPASPCTSPCLPAGHHQPDGVASGVRQPGANLAARRQLDQRPGAAGGRAARPVLRWPHHQPTAPRAAALTPPPCRRRAAALQVYCGWGSGDCVLWGVQKVYLPPDAAAARPGGNESIQCVPARCACCRPALGGAGRRALPAAHAPHTQSHALLPAVHAPPGCPSPAGSFCARCTIGTTPPLRPAASMCPYGSTTPALAAGRRRARRGHPRCSAGARPPTWRVRAGAGGRVAPCTAATRPLLRALWSPQGCGASPFSRRHHRRPCPPPPPAANAFLADRLGPGHSARLVGVRDMPKGPSRLSLDFSSLLGPLFAMWLVQVSYGGGWVAAVCSRRRRCRRAGRCRRRGRQHSDSRQ